MFTARPQTLGPCRFWEIYDAIVVRPMLGLARGSARLDRVVLDGIVDGAASFVVALSRVNRAIDREVVDRLVTLTARLVGFVGAFFQMFQGGRLRVYLLILSFALVVLSVGVFYWIGR